MVYGYKFKVIRGYLFERENIFKEYVEDLYKIKLNSKPGSPDYSISKLLLNSLYGRLGMNPNMERHLIISNDDFKNYQTNNNYIVTTSTDFKNGKELISFFDINYKNNKLNVSIPVSSAVTSYSRIFMSKFKLMFIEKGIILYYSDTDNFCIDKELPFKYVGKEFGKFKLERTYKEALFLASKVYAGKTIEGKEIVKIKGSKKLATFHDLLKLLFKNNKLEILHEK
jgi:hypothetical protein